MSNVPAPGQSEEKSESDFLDGVAAIAAFVGKKPRATNHLLVTGKLPGTKIGQGWMSTKSQIRARIRGEA